MYNDFSLSRDFVRPLDERMTCLYRREPIKKGYIILPSLVAIDTLIVET